MTQFLIYGPAHGTPAHARLQAEGRIGTAVMADHRKHDGFYLGFDHPHIGADDMVAIQRRLFHDEFRRLGPSVFRVVDDLLAGHVALRDHPTPRVRDKARWSGRRAHRAMVLIPPSRRYLGAEVNAWLDLLYHRLEQETGRVSGRERLLARLIPAAMRYTAFKLRHEVGQQPEFTRRCYRMSPAPATAAAWPADDQVARSPAI